MLKKNIFLKKKILIYGLGKSGLSSFHFLRKKNSIFIYDDNKNITKNKIKKIFFINYKDISDKKFDFIVISPGINIDNCKLKNYLKVNESKIVTDLDVFYSQYYKNKNITITGTNGKSTTAKILFEVLKDQKWDVRLTGNIGKPILNEKKISLKTIFVIEASSYQIEYTKNFKANYAVLLNITPDHLERHGTFYNYFKSKFKLIRNQTSKDCAFLNVKNKFFKKEAQKKKINTKIINVDINYDKKNLKYIKNSYFMTSGNQENLAYIFALANKLNLNKNSLFKTINSFKGLKYRQQTIFKSKKLTIINDSKATSFSSSVSVLRSLNKVYWIIGGIPKLGDKFFLTKKECTNYTAYIFGNNRSFFIKQLKNRLKCQNFISLKNAIKKIKIDIASEKNFEHKTILFSPSAASFDNFKNFEERGRKFNLLVNKLKIKKLINAKR